MVWVNIDTSSLAYINKGGTNNYVQVDIGESVYAQGAKVIVTTPTRTLTEWLVTGEGLASDQTALLQFGLGKESTILNIKVHLSDDKELSIDNPKINNIIDFKSQINTLLNSEIEMIEADIEEQEE